MRIAKTFLSMTSVFTLALFPSIMTILASALTFDKTSPTLPEYSMKVQLTKNSHRYINPLKIQTTKLLVSFDFVGQFCVLANSFHNCIIYTVRSPRFKVRG